MVYWTHTFVKGGSKLKSDRFVSAMRLKPARVRMGRDAKVSLASMQLLGS